MQTILSRPSHILLVSLSPLLLVFPAHADIYQWEYINPADPSQGKQQSTTLAPDGAGVDAVPDAYLRNIDLTKAYLTGADLTNAYLVLTDLRNAELSHSKGTNANFGGANLTGTSFRQANLANAKFVVCEGDAFCYPISATLTDADLSNSNVTNANFTGAILTGTDFTDANVRSAKFDATGECTLCNTGTGIAIEQLYSTASYRVRDLSGIGLSRNVLNGADLAGQNMAEADFSGAVLTGVDFSGANVRGARFDKLSLPIFPCNMFCGPFLEVGSGLAADQLYSTASYQGQDLSGIGLGFHDLTGFDLAGQDLTNAYFYGAKLMGADFTAADARGAAYLSISNSESTKNLILPNGHIAGVVLEAGGRLVVRDYGGDARDPFSPPRPPIPITVDQHMAMGPGGALQMIFEADAWDSTISFAPGIPVTLGGILELTFADDVSLASQLGRTFDVFNWTGVSPTGAFAINSPYQWDTSHLYSTGEVTLTAIPEPTSAALVLLAAAVVCLARRRRSSASLLVSLSPLLLVCGSAAHADIYQWEYIDPADPSQGKRQSTTLAPDGAGIDAVPGADLRSRDLTMAYLNSADLTEASGSYANLTDADLSQANLTNAHFDGAGLTDADFTDAEIHGADFDVARFCDSFFCHLFGTGITPTQLYSTASYQAHDLSGIGLRFNYLSGGNFAGQNLANAAFTGATLTDADFTGAQVQGANFGRTGITLAQLYSTASFQAHDLTGIGLTGDLSGGNFAGQNLTNASFDSFECYGSDCLRSSATLTDADFRQANLTNTSFYTATLTNTNFTGADVRGASFGRDFYDGGTGITFAQLYSTASYQARDLSGIALQGNNLAGANFTGQNLTNAGFYAATLTDADFRQANLTNADFFYATLTDADLTGAEVRGANLRSTGFTVAQLYSTASYQARDLTGIALAGDVSGGNFAGQNLAGANFAGANLTNANLREANLANANFISCRGTICYHATLADVDLTAADTRGANPDISGAITSNLIRPDGHISGLGLDAGGMLVVRDYRNYFGSPTPFPITVDEHLTMAPGGTLRMVFEADAWDSTISFAPGIPVTLGGTLELTFADDVNLASQVGRTLKIFDWTGVDPSGTFDVSSPYHWDLANLYITGELTLLAIPEPSAAALAMMASLSIAQCLSVRKRSSSVNTSESSTQNP